MRIEGYVVVTQYDCVSARADRPADGPLVHESYVEKMSLEEAQKRAAALRGRYGWAYVAEFTLNTDDSLLNPNQP